MNPAAALAEQRALEALRKLSPPELRETANGFDPEDGSPLLPVVLGVPRARFIELARFVLVNPKATRAPGFGGVGDVTPPPPASTSTPGRLPVIIGGFVLVGIVAWWIVRSAK